MDGIEIGIVETRNIIRLVNELYHYDFNDFALTSFKRRLENIISVHNLKTADNLHSKLREERTFFDTFLHEIMVEPTEMFRDPSLWRILRDDYLTQMARGIGKIKVWFPMTVSGEELFTFLILLKELGLSDKCDVSVSCISARSREFIDTARIRQSKIEVSNENYNRFHGLAKLTDYYVVLENYAKFNGELFRNINLNQQDLGFDNAPKAVDLIFFRNQMLYFNQGLQDRIADVLYESLSFNGYLVTGIRDKAFIPDGKKNLRIVDQNENIYQKK